MPQDEHVSQPTRGSHEEQDWQHLQAHSPWLQQHALRCVFRAGVHRQPSTCRSGEGCCHLLEEDDGQKRRAAQDQATSCPGGLTQEIILFCKRFCTQSGAVQAPAHRLCTQNEGDRSSIPILEMGRAKLQKMLTHLLGCQHTPSQSCEPLRFHGVH